MAQEVNVKVGCELPAINLDSILKIQRENLSPERRAQLIIADKDAVIKNQADEIAQIPFKEDVENG